MTLACTIAPVILYRTSVAAALRTAETLDRVQRRGARAGATQTDEAQSRAVR